MLDQEGKVRLYEDPDEPPAPFGEPMQRTRGPQEPEATPDIVFRMPDGQVILVGEVKNTAKGGPLPERSEVNQAVSYAVRYRLDKALVVRPRTEGAEGGLFYAGQVGDVAVYDYKVDLSDADVHAVAGAFADAIAALLPPEATRPTSQ